MLNTLISQLMSELQLDKSILKQSPSGEYILSFNKDYSVKISETPQGVIFNSRMANVPAPSKEDSFIEQSMHANLFGRGTNDGVVGLTPDGDGLTFTQVFENFNNFKDFKLQLENFLNEIDYWRESSNK